MPTAPISVLTEFSIPGQTLTPRQDDRIKVTSLPKESSMPTQNSIYPLKIRYGQSVLGHLDYWQVHPIHHLSCSSAGSLSGSLGLVHGSVAAQVLLLIYITSLFSVLPGSRSSPAAWYWFIVGSGVGLSAP